MTLRTSRWPLSARWRRTQCMARGRTTWTRPATAHMPCNSRNLVTAGSACDAFLVNPGLQFWCMLGIILSPMWMPFCAHFGCHFRSILGIVFGPFLESFSVHFGCHFRSILGVVFGPFLEPFSVHLWCHYGVNFKSRFGSNFNTNW